jgi:hypothetical protein
MSHKNMPEPSIKDVWKEAWDSPVKRRQLIIVVLFITISGIALPYFFNYIEKRNGIVLNDWVLAQIPSYNVSVLIFAVIWGMILLVLYRSLYKPSIFIIYAYTLALVTVARVICISLVPLAPPVGLIRLSDPLSGIFYGEASITKDLFFSGHMATLSVIFFCLEKKTDKLIGLFAVIILAILLVIQHIHYTIDILAAPVIVYAVYSITSRFILLKEVKRRKVKQPDELAKVYRVNN